jgi:ketosteroid isomerase-like protein
MNMSRELNELIDAYHDAALEFVKGNPRPYLALFSRREDVSIANPFGPVATGWERASEVMERASALYRDGELVGFENLVAYEGADLAYIVEEERFIIKVAGSAEPSLVSLRTTSIFRREDGEWKIAHRHADPITTARPPQSVVQR